MTKPQTKKLSLSTSTLRCLDHASLRAVAGGASARACPPPTQYCITDLCVAGDFS